MITVKRLHETSFDELYGAFNLAFQDYDRTWTRDEFEKLLRRRGYEATMSFGAFDGDRLVSFTLNGAGLHNGKQTAYDTGTGTIKEYRGKGLATMIFNKSLPYFRQA